MVVSFVNLHLNENILEWDPKAGRLWRLRVSGGNMVAHILLDLYNEASYNLSLSTNIVLWPLTSRLIERLSPLILSKLGSLPLHLLQSLIFTEHI